MALFGDNGTISTAWDAIFSKPEEELTPEESYNEALDNYNDVSSSWTAPTQQTVTDPDSPYYGMTIEVDDSGNYLSTIADYSSLFDQVEDLQDFSFPDLQTWMDENGLEMGTLDSLKAAVDSLTADMQDLSPEELAAAEEYKASQFGLSVDEYRDLMRELTVATSGFELDDSGNWVGGQSPEGFTDQQRATFNREIARDIAQQSEAAQRMVNSIMASTGSSTRALAAADNYTNNINNYAIKARTQLIEDEMAAAQAKIQSQQEFKNSMVTQGQMAESQYLDWMFQSQANALQGYSLSMSAVMQENQQYLDMYAADLDAISRSMDATYQGIMAELGVTESLASATQTWIDDYYKAFNQKMSLAAGDLTAAYGAWEIENTQNEQDWQHALGIAGLTVDIIGLFVQPTASPAPTGGGNNLGSGFTIDTNTTTGGGYGTTS